MEEKEVNIDEVVDLYCEMEDYLYDWANSREGKFGYIDHTRWGDICLLLFQQYKFNLDDIKNDIINGTILLPHFSKTKRITSEIEKELYNIHLDKAKEFEHKYNLK